MTLPTWTNSGAHQYDYAITGLKKQTDGSVTSSAIPFLAWTSKDYPYQRDSANSRKQQIDTAHVVGEQSLQAWWYRSQASFDLGAGIKFMDPLLDANLSTRYADSCGVNVFEAGQVTLIRKTNKLSSGTISGPVLAVGIANSGQEGALVWENGQMRKYLSSGTGSNVAWGGTGTVLDLVSDGGAYYAATNAHIYRGVLPDSAATNIYNFPTGITRSKLGYAKRFLWVAGNQYLWKTATTPVAQPTSLLTDDAAVVTDIDKVGAFYAHQDPSWTWSAVADGPVAAYFAGYSGDYSAIYATRLSTADTPALVTPFVVAELPRGERILSMLSYLGTYMVLGTNLGVRVAIIDGGGSLTVGPLSVTSDADVTSLYARGDYVWAAGANCDGATGVYCINLSTTVDNQSLRFPWQRSQYIDGNTWAGKTVTSIVPIGYTGRIGFGVTDVGFAMEVASERVASGWLETGKLRFDTAEDKVFQFIRVSNLSVDGSIKLSWRNEAGVLADLYTYNTTSVRTLDTLASDVAPHPWVSYRFTLQRGTTSTANTPVLLGYQVKAQPANVQQRLIQVALACFQREKSKSGRIVERSTWDRIKALEMAEELGAVVRFQDMGTGENRLAIIERVLFKNDLTSETRAAQANPGGVLIVTLRTVTATS